MKFVVFKHKADNVPDPREAESFDAFAKHLHDKISFRGPFDPDATDDQINAQKDGELFSTAEYSPGVTRSNGGVLRVHALTLDFDDRTNEEVEEIRESLKPLRYVICATYSHRWAQIEGKNCFRVILELSEPVAKKNWNKFWGIAVHHFNAAADKSCSDPARMFYYPSYPIGTDIWFEDVPGTPLDVDEYMEMPVPEWVQPDKKTNGLKPLPLAITTAFARAVDAAGLQRGSLRGDGKLPIHCPWSETITSKGGHVPGAETSTVVWVDGLKAGYFDCKHQTCKGRSREDFLRWLRDEAPEAATFLHPDDMRDEIECIEDKAHSVINDTVRSLARGNTLYQRGNALVRILTDVPPDPDFVRDPNTPTIARVPQPALREIISSRASFVKSKYVAKTNSFDKIKVLPPPWVVEMVETRGLWPEIHNLEGIVEFPTLRADGSVITEPGWDAKSGVEYLKPRSAVPPIPDDPTDEQVADAVMLLDDLLIDFNFALPEGRSGFYAALLTPMARYAFKGAAPLFLFDSSTPATGKGFMAKIAGIIATGHIPGSSQYTDNNEELDKRILAWASAGERLVCLDNIGESQKLGGTALCMALTEEIYEGRVLGMSTNWKGPQLVTFYATGNNVSLDKDMDRRICHIRLDSNVERPEERTDFKYPDIVAHTREYRNEYAASALTILVAYHAYLRKGGTPPKVDPWGSYTTWSDHVVRAIVHAGLPDPGKARVALRRGSDLDAPHRSTFLHGLEVLLQKHGNGKGLTAREIVTLMFPASLPHATDPAISGLQEAVRALLDLNGRDVPPARKMGELLARLRDRIIGGRMIIDVGANRDGVLIWAIKTTH